MVSTASSAHLLPSARCGVRRRAREDQAGGSKSGLHSACSGGRPWLPSAPSSASTCSWRRLAAAKRREGHLQREEERA
eukprot:scaffold148899_cov28-Tisochrysis_lutea.AAC.4